MVDFSNALHLVRERAPLVQCITNFVTVNDCANIILAAGGSPSMAHDIREVEDAVSGVQALVCNMGAGEDVVLDPVAAGGTRLRRESAKRLLEEVRFAALRGNASEIRSLAGQEAAGSGVDAAAADTVSQDSLPAALQMVTGLARRTGSVIALSGPLDVISDGEQAMVLRNGCPAMARITGSGCMLTSLIGAFCGAMPSDPFAAVCAAMAAMGVCGEIADSLRLAKGTGNATFRTDLIDAVFNLTEKQLTEGVRYEIYQG